MRLAVHLNKIHNYQSTKAIITAFLLLPNDPINEILGAEYDEKLTNEKVQDVKLTRDFLDLVKLYYGKIWVMKKLVKFQEPPAIPYMESVLEDLVSFYDAEAQKQLMKKRTYIDKHVWKFQRHPYEFCTNNIIRAWLGCTQDKALDVEDFTLEDSLVNIERPERVLWTSLEDSPVNIERPERVLWTSRILPLCTIV